MIPALIPNPARKSRAERVSSGAGIPRIGSRARLPVYRATVANAATRQSVPMWVATKYTQPDSLTAGSWSSALTKKKADKAMISHATRKRNAFRARTINTMLAGRMP
jgi:hypothetical protein